jgi:YggT family protein
MAYLVNFLTLLITILRYAVLIRVLLSWIRVNPNNPVVQILYQITDPVLKPFQRIIPPMGGLDFSPIAAYFVLQFLQQFIQGLQR